MMTTFTPIPAEADGAAGTVVDAALKVHKALGPGLLESVYEICLAHELKSRGLAVERQVALPVTYDGVKLDAGLRLDILVERQVVVEVKAVEQMNPIYEAQLLTYLKLTGLRVGLLVNFNVKLLRDGIKRLVL
jgi:GxxExxY protein